ncbi:hypothetical protein JL100_002825 [Skermanella mucosa]|uniref:hypothetical protein n=1 Tax=Skermanella mucosa TaxID=1789672 RepID=UPI00192B62C4|nr:hypothetical protein [Skermanella mucosa]UEM21717.1 hypothetical protein JL100_002825 [Skermanella mucosa]
MEKSSILPIRADDSPTSWTAESIDLSPASFPASLTDRSVFFDASIILLSSASATVAALSLSAAISSLLSRFGHRHFLSSGAPVYAAASGARRQINMALAAALE